MSLDMEITLVAAVSKNGVIGKDGTIPWSLPTDLKHFKKLTENGVVIMGRKTFESIGNKPLAKRHNIVVSKTMSRVNIYSNLSVVSSLDEALWEAQEDYKEAFIIGGEAIYKEAMSMASKMIISHVDAVIKNGTARFPYINTKIAWREEARVKADINSRDDHEYSIVTYKRLVETVNQGYSPYTLSEFKLGPLVYIDDHAAEGSGDIVFTGIGSTSITIPAYGVFDSTATIVDDKDKK